jgi:hypothetical protein
MTRRFHHLALTLALLAGSALAQHVPETGPRIGEHRFNDFIYKASHNSYERSEPLNEQIDHYNVWQLELDMWWEGNGCDISVEHFCASVHDAQSLTTELSEIATSLTADQRFTVIYMETKNPLDGNPCYEDWPGRSEYIQCIYNTIDGVLGAEHVYTVNEFKSVDGSRWPSRPELQRRGKNFVFILDDQDIGGPFDDEFFFSTTGQNPPGASLPDNTVLVSINAGCDIDSIDSGPAERNDRWLYRAWPDASRCDACWMHNGNYWDNAVNFGFNLIATNCVSEDHTFAVPTHSPQPLFVLEPQESSGRQLGTLGFPYIGVVGLIAGVNRASAMVDVVISGGTYDVTAASGGPYVIDKPVVLQTRPSTAGHSAVLR